MSFERSWVLLLAWLPLAWAFLAWRGSTRRVALALKALAFVAILLALAGPRLTYYSSKMAVAVLVDTSASVSPADLQRASELATRIEEARGRHWTRVLPFARSTRSPDASEVGGSWDLKHTVGEAGRGTDLEAAIREGIAAFPSGAIPRLVLISDGKENIGSVARAAWQAEQLGVPIDTFLLAGRARPELLLESVMMPAEAFTGERFPVELAVHAPRRSGAVVETAAEGKVLNSTPVILEEGLNRVRLNANLSTAGVIDFSGAVRADGLGEVRFARALALRRPRVLFVSQDPPGTEVHLLGALETAQFDVEQSREGLPRDLPGYQVIVFNNWDLEAVPPADKLAVEEFVRRGGGLLVVAGENNVYAELREREDPLERALPAKVAPPRSPEGTCVVLIIDKSSSMEGRRMELARQAAIGVVENLRPDDRVGVLIFDNSFHWAVPIRRAEDRTLIKRLIAGIVADGGTQIAPALAEAYRHILPVNATFRHLLLLTDGISEEGDSMSLARQALENRVTISTIGLGRDVNRPYLEKVAALAGGKAYFVTDPAELQQVTLRDVMEHTGKTAVEKPVHPVIERQAEVLDGVGMSSAPPLRGYVKFEIKPTADMILSVERRDPLLAHWQFGLGRAAVFASDAKSRWAADWIGWEGFERFWVNVFQDLLPHAQTGEASIEYDSAQDALVAEYRLARETDDPGEIPDIFVFGPRDFQRPISVVKVAEGAFRGRVPIGGRQGLFRIRPLAESRAFPEIGYYRPEQELNDYGSNESVLRQISEFTLGSFEPPVERVFDPGGRRIATTMRLWPGLLGLAILLSLAELVMRKWRGILETWRGSR